MPHATTPMWVTFGARSAPDARWRTLLAIVGPGLVVMVGDNDAGAFGRYSRSRCRTPASSAHARCRFRPHMRWAMCLPCGTRCIAGRHAAAERDGVPAAVVQRQGRAGPAEEHPWMNLFAGCVVAVVPVMLSVLSRLLRPVVACAPLWPIVAVQQHALSIGLPAKPRKP